MIIVQDVVFLVSHCTSLQQKIKHECKSSYIYEQYEWRSVLKNGQSTPFRNWQWWFKFSRLMQEIIEKLVST
jgi:hypothetical protein